MPFKTCPKCSKNSGVRTLNCTCGFTFGNKLVETGIQKSKSAGVKYLPGGEWRWDNPEGKSRFPRPQPLPRDRKLTISEVQDYVRYEGVGDALHFIHHNKIEDEKLAIMWKDGRSILKTLVEYVYDK